MNGDTKTKMIGLLWNDDVTDKECHMLFDILCKIIPSKQ